MSTPKRHVGMKRYATETTSTSSTRAIGTPSMAIIGMSTQDPKPELTQIIPRTTATRQTWRVVRTSHATWATLQAEGIGAVETVPALA